MSTYLLPLYQRQIFEVIFSLLIPQTYTSQLSCNKVITAIL